MKTAREQLFDEVTTLLVKRAEDGGVGIMKKIMARYRVQTKPGIEIGVGATARDALGERLIDLWRTGANDDDTRNKMGTLIDQFRMQLKQSGASDKPDKPDKPDRPDKPAPSLTSPAAPRPRPSERPAGHATAVASAARPELKPAPAAKRPPMPASKLTSTLKPLPTSPSVSLGMSEAPARPGRGAEPVAGGPRARKKARGECPKCKSLGVVLARSYSGDEYYSCIYCGWQAYRPADEDDPNASLAVRLLGQTLGSD